MIPGIAIAQINPTIGDVEGNLERILEAARQARGADLVVYPELALSGYPPRDLLLRRSFLDRIRAALERLAAESGPAALLVGCPTPREGPTGRPLHNSAVLLRQGRIEAVRHKTLLPSYDVFDESRYFEPAGGNPPVDFLGLRLGISICEDIWDPRELPGRRAYPGDPVSAQLEAGCDLLINISASPWEAGKHQRRLGMLQERMRPHRVPLVYCNMVGGNDELVFDGSSLDLAAGGEPRHRCASFATEVHLPGRDPADPSGPGHPPEECLRRALVLGIADFSRKCGFGSALVGLSGGIDSALTAALAAQALGRDRVRGIAMPSRHSSPESLEDARELARNLGIRLDVLSIEPAFEAVLGTLSPLFGGPPGGAAEENLQARLRGLLLMALSNKCGALLLSTGNKSELAVGYCTLYGDMCGGLAPLSDVTKTRVWKLARHINRDGEAIPRRSIEKPPSAELSPGQRDQDSLPPYEALDAVLESFVERGLSAGEMEAAGLEAGTVRQTIRLVERAEHKRRQAAPGLRVTGTAFGWGRRLPIARKAEDAPPP